MNPFQVVVSTFSRTFIIKANANKGRNLPPPHLPDITFINQEATDCIKEKVVDGINKATMRAIIATRDTPFCLFILCFTVSVTVSINRPDSLSDTSILILSFKLSFEMYSLNFFSALSGPFIGPYSTFYQEIHLIE